MARLAIQHINNRDSRFVSEIATLPNGTGQQLELREVLFGQEDDLVDVIYNQYQQAKLINEPPPVALIGVLSTEQVEDISQLSQQYDIPVFSVAKAGALGLHTSTAAEYSNIYRMVAPVTEIARVVISLIQKFQFKHSALLYDPTNDEELRILREMDDNNTGTNFTLDPYAVATETGGDLAETIDTLLRKLDVGGVRTFVLLVRDSDKLQLVMERAHRLGMCGDKPSAAGASWIAATGSVPWELPNAVEAEYIGMIAIQQHTYDADKIKLMAEEWRKVMPRGCGLSPTSPAVKFSTVMRNHMPITQCIGLANSYDSVVALSIAGARLNETVAERRLDGHRWEIDDILDYLGPQQDFENERCGDAALGNESLALNVALRSGVSFHGLSGIVQRSGNPWAEKKGTWDITNKDKKGSSNTVLTWTDANGLQDAGDRGTATRLRRLSSYVPGLVWPGNVSAEEARQDPDMFSFTASPCLNKDCGNFGNCQMRPAIAREAGWCKCSDMFIGRSCETFYEPYRLTDHPNVKTKEPTTVWLLPYVDKFHGIDSDEGTFEITMHTLFMWNDDRVKETLDPGQYTEAQARALKNEQLLWLPQKVLRRVSTTVELGGDFHIEENGTMALVIHAEYQIAADMDWRSFPNDKQELTVHLVPGGSYESRFIVGNCSMEFLPDSVVQVCKNMEHFGVPDDTIDRWPSLWEFLSAEMSVDDDGIKLTLEVQRDASTFNLRILVPSIFLVVISWAGFYINPKTLMPRFASSFISFLALQTFKTNAQKLTPADAAMITWTDVYMSAVGIMMVLAVIENMFVPFANEHWAERSALFIDVYSRFSFPVAFVVVLAVMLSIREPSPFLSVFVHSWLVGFSVVSLCVAVWEYRTFKHTIIQRELRRVKNAVRKQANLKLTMKAVELKSIFNAIDNDGSGIVEAEEIFPYLQKHFSQISKADADKMQEMLKTELGEAFHHGVALDKFEPLFTKAMYLMVDHDHKRQASGEGENGGQKDGLHRV